MTSARKPDMPTSSSSSPRLRDYTRTPFEIFIVVFTIVPFFVLAYFYAQLPARVPLFLNLRGEVVTWAQTNVLSVFRVPLMAVITQVVCLLMKYGVVQSMAGVPLELDAGRKKLQEQFLGLSGGLWDCFRLAVAFKMSAASLDTIFLSIERFNYLSRPAFVVSAVAATVSKTNFFTGPSSRIQSRFGRVQRRSARAPRPGLHRVQHASREEMPHPV